jgi:hypothetical protein
MIGCLIALQLLLAAPCFAAELFNGTTDNGRSSSIEISAVPVSLCCWAKPANATDALMALSIGDTATDDEAFFLRFNGNAVGDPVQAAAASGGSGGTASSSAGFTASAWNHGCAVFESSTSRAAYVNGGGKGTNATSITPSGLDAMAIGRYERLTPVQYFNGDLAECGVWNVALTDDEVATLGKGFAPPCVHRGSLLAYYPMIRDTTSLKDRFSDTTNNLTLTGGAVSDHPRVIQCR